MPRELPSGTVTFLFTDIEGSTKLLHDLGDEPYAAALAEHRRILRESFARHGGIEVDTQGDAFFVAFPTAPGALAAARDGQEALASGPIRVRMGLHTGTPLLTAEGYVGPDLHRAARIAAAGHGGQVLLSASTVALIGTDGPRDLGAHRLKDLAAPERIYQLGDADFPALKSLHQTNLPVPLTPFLGRERELAEVVGLVSRGDVRLLTLTGPGGTGKTRLASQAAGELGERYPGGVWWIPLAPLNDPSLVLSTAAEIVGAKDGLAEHIGDTALLLLFDNFEQLMDAAGEVAGVLASCPNLKVLVTSREPLHLAGEHEYPVPPLAPAEGAALFLARARAVDPNFEPGAAVPAICRRLDDLPLAIELAAARVKALSPAQILQRLERSLPLLTGGPRDLPERQRTLRAAIAWSYDLLTPEEQRLFARLAVFRDGCTLEAAEAVTDADVDTLQSLVDKSLLRQRDERFAMLETIREFATEQLEASGEADELRHRHAEHFLALAEEAEPHLRGGRPNDWLDRLETEHDNLRAALDWFAATGQSELELQLAGALSRFRLIRGHLAESRRQLEHALAADERPTAARARALNGAGAVSSEMGDYETATRRLEEASALYSELGDAWGAARATVNLGATAANEQHDYARGRDIFEKSVRVFGELGDEHMTLWSKRMLAWMHYELGDVARARELHEDVVSRAREIGDEPMQATSLGALAEYAVVEGRVEDAIPLLKESTRIYLDSGELEAIATNLWRFARALIVKGQAEAAAQLLARSELLYEEIGYGVEAYIKELNDETRAMIRVQLDDAAFAEASERGRRLKPEAAVALALEALE